MHDDIAVLPVGSPRWAAPNSMMPKGAHSSGAMPSEWEELNGVTNETEIRK
jgi:hypothetical protein